MMKNSLFNLSIGEEKKEKVLANVRSGISFTGSNFWILACAIIVASIGLNVNSTAVVIGAMLISPLMGPIVGAGFALGTYDFVLLRISLKNLLISTLVGLVVSFVYFLLTPYKEAQSEILARTAPNIYDVLIAFFGGLVGVIAVTRVEKGNPIPGVAIATALMPPLCTAGFGLAMGEFSYFGGAMFLYAINCVFICIATFIIVKYLKYPAVGFTDPRKEKTVRNSIYISTALMIVPSLYFAYKFLERQRFYDKVSEFVTKEFEDKGNTVIFRKTSYSSNPKKVELAFLTRRFTNEQILAETHKLEQYGLTNTRLIIRQDSAFLATAPSNKANEVDGEANIIASELNAKIDRNTLNTDNLYREARAILPDLQSISASRQQFQSAADSIQTVPVVIYQSSQPITDTQEAMLCRWLKVKLKVDTVEIYRR